MDWTVIIVAIINNIGRPVYNFIEPKISRCIDKIWQCFGLEENGNQGDQAIDGPEGGQVNNDQEGGQAINGQEGGQASIVKTNDPGQSSSGGQKNPDLSTGSQTNAGPSQGGQSSGELIFLAGDLEIKHRDDKESWDWPVNYPNEPRFKEAAQLRYDTWVEIKVRIEVRRLSPNTNYDAYFIFQTTEDSQGLGLIQDAYIYVGKKKYKKYLSTKKVCLKPTFDTPGDKPYLSPKKFSDEWMELNLGQFNSDAVTSYKEVVIKIKEINDFQQKTGLIVAGMELRPIKPKSMGQ